MTTAIAILLVGVVGAELLKAILPQRTREVLGLLTLAVIIVPQLFRLL